MGGWFDGTPGSFSCSFRDSLVFVMTMGIIVESASIRETSFSTATQFPIDFNDFMRLCGQVDVALKTTFIKIMEDNSRKVKNGPQKRHIDVDLHV